jgi:sugar lactone lactonase YvrE
MAAGPPSGDTAPGLVVLGPADGGPARIVADDLAFPNGMAVTPDNSTLIVADPYRNQIMGLCRVGVPGPVAGQQAVTTSGRRRRFGWNSRSKVPGSELARGT